MAVKDTVDVAGVPTVAGSRALIVEESRGGETAPTHRMDLGKTEIGAGWARRSQEERCSIAIKLDDPSLSAPL